MIEIPHTGNSAVITVDSSTNQAAGDESFCFNRFELVPQNFDSTNTYSEVGDHFTTAGWSNQLSTSTGDGMVHGNFGVSHGEVTKTFTAIPEHKTLKLSMRYWAIDSWDSEDGIIKIDGTEVWRKKNTESGWNQYTGSFPNPWGGDNNAHCDDAARAQQSVVAVGH